MIRVQRTTLIVADLERSLALYRDTLGFEVAYIKNSRADSYSYPTFDIPAAAVLRFATLTAGAGSSAQLRVLGLTEVKGATLARPSGVRPVALVLEASNLVALEEEIARLPGVRVLPAGNLLTQDGRAGREVAVQDADGHLVVLYELATD